MDIFWNTEITGKHWKMWGEIEEMVGRASFVYGIQFGNFFVGFMVARKATDER